MVLEPALVLNCNVGGEGELEGGSELISVHVEDNQGCALKVMEKLQNLFPCDR